MESASPAAHEEARTRVVIVEPVTLVRTCLRTLLAQDSGFEIAGEASNVSDGVRLADSVRPNLLLMNIGALGMSVSEVVRQLRQQLPETRLMVLLTNSAPESVAEAYRAGVHGYVNITASLTELHAAIRQTLTGARARPAGADTGRACSGPPALARLTRRENQVLTLIASGYTNKEIAARLCLSISTVERHRTNLIKKLDLHNAAALTAYAIRSGLVAIERAPASFASRRLS